jgi:hypothetical protein
MPFLILPDIQYSKQKKLFALSVFDTVLGTALYQNRDSLYKLWNDSGIMPSNLVNWFHF